MSESFIWNPSHQRQYYHTLCNQYLRELFRHIQRKPFLFYVDYDISNMNDVVRYYTQSRIDITPFYRPKQFVPYHTFPLFKDTNFHDVDTENIGYTIEEFPEMTEDDKNGISGCCGQCGEQYGGGFWFNGKAYNTGLNGENPIDYSGYIKTYDFNQCLCDEQGKNEILCFEKDDFPHIVIDCAPNPNHHNIGLMSQCVSFDIGFTDIPA